LADWRVVQQQLATIAADVACSAPGVCLCPVGVNGAGTKILYTTDGGKSFTSEPSVSELMYLGGAICGDSAALSTLLWLEYNQAFANDTFNFVNAKCPGGFQSQNVECSDSNTFFATGLSLPAGATNGGVAVSRDAGATFSFVPAAALLTQARYGAFPSGNTWYVSAGNWPSSQTERDEDAFFAAQGMQFRRLNSRISTLQDGKSIKRMLRTEPRTLGATGAFYAAQIAKTTDGGKSWKSVFFQNNTFYFNQIACGSEQSCVAVGEADSDSPAPGVRIWTTADGGHSWQNTFSDSDSAKSMMACFAVSETEYWAGGGSLSSSIQGIAYHSIDGGMTWTTETVPGVYFNNIGTHCICVSVQSLISLFLILWLVFA
jgi:hypothetical protein